MPILPSQLPPAIHASPSSAAIGPASVEHTPRDWSATLRTDAQALHDDIAANHPGPVNRADPGFAARNDAQLALALARARTARSYRDYFYALRWYAASFDDGHFGLGATGAPPVDNAAWPGFLTAYDEQGRQRVVDRASDSPVPLGATLVGCDGRSAEALAADTVGVQVGRWQLESQRRRYGALLFASAANPYVHRSRRCTFRVDGRTLQARLDWRPIDPREQSRRIDAIRHATSYAFAARTLPDGMRWYAIPSFDADPASPAGKALPGLIEHMRTDRDRLAAAPAIVLDLRGNGGGSSDWSYQIAKILWGSAALARVPAHDVQVDWRASPANLRSLETDYDERRRVEGMSPEADRWFRTTIDGLRGAVGRGEPLWRDASDYDATPTAPAVAGAALRPLAGPVFLVTDGACGSACLDAADLWRSLGAIHVGRTTSADTLYMEVRLVTLPSGLMEGGLPMKVYRGRPRGANEPVVPAWPFAGDITDTPALERWIATLPVRRAGSAG